MVGWGFSNQGAAKDSGIYWDEEMSMESHLTIVASTPLWGFRFRGWGLGFDLSVCSHTVDAGNLAPIRLLGLTSTLDLVEGRSDGTK